MISKYAIEKCQHYFHLLPICDLNAQVITTGKKIILFERISESNQKNSHLSQKTN